MSSHTDEMRNFILLTEAFNPAIKDDFDQIAEDFAEVEELPAQNIVEDIKDITFKIEAHRIDGGSEQFNQGFEEAVMLFSDMLNRLVERYDSDSRGI